MVANLKLRANKWYCGNCMMRTPGIVPACPFCDAIISNYEELKLKELARQEAQKEYIRNETSGLVRNK